MTISEAVWGYYALKEIPGEQHNPEILAMFKELDHSWAQTDETAWCAALANVCLKRANFPHTGLLFAKSFLAIGDQISVPRPLGSCEDFVDVVLFYRGKPWTSDDPDDFEPGHVAFFLKERGNLIHVVGGNQGNMMKVSGYKRSELEQFRRIYK